MAIKIDREELAWAAGFFDGEGSITGLHAEPGRRGPRTSILVPQSGDPATLVRFQRAIGGLGNLNGQWTAKYKGVEKKPRYCLSITNFEHAQAVIAMLWSWLSSAKRAQAVARLTALADYRAMRSAV